MHTCCRLLENVIHASVIEVTTILILTASTGLFTLHALVSTFIAVRRKLVTFLGQFAYKTSFTTTKVTKMHIV